MDRNESVGHLLLEFGLLTRDELVQLWTARSRVPGWDLLAELERAGRVAPGAAQQIRRRLIKDAALSHTHMVEGPLVAPAPPESGVGSRRAGSDGGSRSASATATSQATAAAQPGDRRGDWVLEEELGAGGAGRVFAARDAKLGRRAAIKLLKAVDESARERFELEAQLMARLQHPNILRVIAVGSEGDEPWIALDLATGGSLAQRLKDGPVSVEDALTWTAKIADGIDAAHRLGIIHRDLKPDNILFRDDGEPVVTDFGLAKQTDSRGPRLSKTGMIMGTPQYMPPEQLEGRHGQIDGRADIYALGATLFEMLAGDPPFDGERLEIIAIKALSMPPPRLRRIRPEVTREAEIIAERCLAKLPEDRYQSALELAEDCRRALAHEPIKAKPVGVWERTRLWARRNVGLAVAAGVLALLLPLGVVAWELDRRARATAAAERTAAARAEGLRRAEEAQKALEVALEKARAAEDEARTNAEKMRRVLFQFGFDVYNEVSALPNSVRARELMIATIFSNLEDLANSDKTRAKDPQLRYELALAYVRLGSLADNLTHGSQGDEARARDCYAKADALYVGLEKEDFEPELVAIARVCLKIRLAGFELRAGRLEAAKTLSLQALADARKARARLEAAKGSSVHQRTLDFSEGQALAALGSVLLDLGLDTEALAAFEEADRIYKVVDTKSFANESVRAAEINLLAAWTDALERVGRRTEADRIFKRLEALAEELSGGQNVIATMEVCAAWTRLARKSLTRHRLAEFIGYAERALRLAEKHWRRDPKDQVALRTFAIALSIALSHPRGAEREDFREKAEAVLALEARDVQLLETHRLLALIEQYMALFTLHRGDPSEALTRIRRARKRIRTLQPHASFTELDRKIMDLEAMGVEIAALQRSGQTAAAQRLAREACKLRDAVPAGRSINMIARIDELAAGTPDQDAQRRLFELRARLETAQRDANADRKSGAKLAKVIELRMQEVSLMRRLGRSTEQKIKELQMLFKALKIIAPTHPLVEQLNHALKKRAAAGPGD